MFYHIKLNFKVMKNFTIPTITGGLRSNSRFICWRQWRLLLLLIGALLISSNINGQVSSKEGIAPVKYPAGGFAIDGDAFANQSPIGTTYDAAGDWFQNSGPEAAVSPVIERIESLSL